MAELTKSNVVTTVYGDRRVVMFEVDAPNSASHVVTGLDFVNWVGAENEDAAGITARVIKNSNSSAVSGNDSGSVYIELSSGTDTISMMAIGK